jgi:signal transduction histidine kinase
VLIEPYKQLRFGLIFLTINLIFSSMILAVIGYFIWDVYTALSVYFQLNEGQQIVTLAKFGAPAAACVTLVILFILTTLILSAKLTHQIYGPLVSIRRFLDELLLGVKPAPIKLRSSDQLQDLAQRLNDLTKVIDIPTEHQTIAMVIEYLKGAINNEITVAPTVASESVLYELCQSVQILVKRLK